VNYQNMWTSQGTPDHSPLAGFLTPPIRNAQVIV
jgi:hypothetical protein